MIRIAAIIAGLVLIACPAVWLAAITIPVPMYRTHGFADFLFLGQTLLAIYGSVLLGIAVHWMRARRSGQPWFPVAVFKAGVVVQPLGRGMATFIAIVKRDGDAGYTASFPDFPSCAVAAQTIDHVIARAKEALSLHIERLLEANHRICDPTAADEIERGGRICIWLWWWSLLSQLSWQRF